MMQKAYIAYNRNPQEIEKSSSGGMFQVFSSDVLNRGGVVVSAAYNYEKQFLEHIVCRSDEERDKCRGSKYIQSSVNSQIYHEVENSLKKGDTVLYVGTPCQIAAVKRYLDVKKTNQELLYTIDILCHGVGSPGIWESFIKNLEKRYSTQITYLTFKDKKNGWKNPRCIAFDGKREYSLRGYSWLYFSNAIMRPSCYACKYTTTDRMGDITIGDFWKVNLKHPDMYNSRGTSFIITNSEKGEHLLEKVKKELVIKECSLMDIIQNNMMHPTPRSSHKEKVFRDFQKKKPIFFFNKWQLILLIERLKLKVFG